ncbi:hypothetical protein [Longimycelium tulufanense]|uniref:hypothetical protein n=1 Tax=Longimycelium tulufanense TaxID=907463 RepID=UPI001667A374|nr:hypothetical protein [Longimycelium tulufanense]
MAYEVVTGARTGQQMVVGQGSSAGVPAQPPGRRRRMVPDPLLAGAAGEGRLR